MHRFVYISEILVCCSGNGPNHWYPPSVRPPDFNSSGLCRINNGGKKETELLQGLTPDPEWSIRQSGMSRKQSTKEKRVEIYVEYDPRGTLMHFKYLCSKHTSDKPYNLLS